MGAAKAQVLPVPVWAQPSTSRPASAGGIAFSWMGEGEMPADQLRKMREIISQTHKEGKLFRWLGAPDTPQFQRFFMEEGVDLIGADDLEALHKLLVEE